MTKASSISAVVLLAILTATTALGVALNPFEGRNVPIPHSQIDKLVFSRLEQLGIEPANICSDAVFVRRAYLDVIGTLPTAQEARAFLSDRTPNKRKILIDRLLERDEFADYWAMKWGDLLRIKAEFPINLWPNAVQAYHRWIRTCIKDNMPYNRFVREMLTANGSNFRDPRVNFYRSAQSKEPKALAQAVALTFMGARAENWEDEKLADMAAFFSRIAFKSTAEWKEEIVFFDPNMPAAHISGDRLSAVFPDGTTIQFSASADPRKIFADWLIAPKNPWFVRNIVNRIWSWLLGRGIIHEPDDIRDGNPPSNPELLAYLEKELVSHKYDLKHIYRLILNSKTYQLSSIAKSDNPQAVANFASYPIRQLEAEVLIDALCQITGTTEEYESAIPEPFTYIPEDQRSIALTDGSITSSFLEMFGRPPRDTGLESERNNNPTADQRLHMLNSSHIQRKIERSPKLRFLMQSRGNPKQVTARLYLTILSRFPTDEELKTVADYSLSRAGNKREVAMDLVWVLFNSAEFLYRH